MLLALALMFFDHADAFDDDALFIAEHADDLAAFAAFGAGDHHDFVALFHVKSAHNLQTTSGAREMIFMNFLSRSSRATGPKMRVPRGLFSLSMMTMALVSKRKYRSEEHTSELQSRFG